MRGRSGLCRGVKPAMPTMRETRAVMMPRAMMTAMSTTKETRANDAMTPTAQMPRWRSARTGRGPLESFKRLAEDGKLFTKPEFYEYFGTLHEWNMAGESEVVVNTTDEVIAPTPVRRPLEQIDEAQEEEAQTALLQQQPGCEILKNAHEGVQDDEWPELPDFETNKCRRKASFKR